MTKTGRKSTTNLPLKIAIVKSEKTQRKIAHDTEIGEVRLSAIVCGRGTPATKDEKSKIATALGRRVDELFDTETERPDASASAAHAS